MRIVIVGSNALACLLAARLAPTLQPDDSLNLLVRDPQSENRIIQDGFTLIDGGMSSYYRINSHARVSQGPDDHDTLALTALRCCLSTGEPDMISNSDLVLLCDRADTATDTITAIKPFLSPATLLISMQQGISQIRPMEQLAAEHRSAVALAVDNCAVFQKNNQVSCLDPGTFTITLLNRDSTAADQLRQAVNLLIQANLRVEILADNCSETIQQQLWTRFFHDIAINPLAAIYQRPNGQLLTSCSVRGNMKKALREAIAVAQAADFTINRDPVKQVFQYLRREKKAIAPMLRDIKNKQPTAIAALNGTICRLGRELAIATPTNDDLVMRIKKLEAAYL
jgi:2-dehydropantoate 2-reductase